MSRFFITMLLLGAVAEAHASGSACIPVALEAPLPVPTGAVNEEGRCIRYVQTPATVGGEQAKVLLFGDPQVKSEVDVGYFGRDIVAPLRARDDLAFGITMGDLVNDVLEHLPAVKAVTETLGIPWLFAPGNHDVDPDATSDEDSLREFQRVVGPETQARETALVNVVALDDVILMPGKKPGYIGGLREDQFAFLERWLPTLGKDKLLVIAAHIHLFDEDGEDNFRDADRLRLFELLKSFPNVLVVTAHSHTQRNVFYTEKDGWHGEKPLHEFNLGATCGSYWSGAPDAEGIPASTMKDGTPNGYAVLTVRQGGAYGLEWHNAREPNNAQIGLHAPKLLRQGAYPAWGVFANVYMGDADTRVEYRVDDGEWKPMKKVLRPDPLLMAENRRDDEADALRGFDRSPEAEVSQHLWRGALPTKLAVGEHAVEVRAFDRWRGEVRASTTYRLEQASP